MKHISYFYSIAAFKLCLLEVLLLLLLFGGGRRAYKAGSLDSPLKWKTFKRSRSSYT